jgi:hypothetical protein
VAVCTPSWYHSDAPGCHAAGSAGGMHRYSGR